MCPFLTEELQPKIQKPLQMPHLEDESLNIELFIQDFLVKRFLVHKFTPDLETKDPDYE